MKKKPYEEIDASTLLETAIKEKLEESGVPFTPVNAIGNQYPMGSYVYTPYDSGQVSKAELSIRIFTETHDQGAIIRDQIIELMQTNWLEPTGINKHYTYFAEQSGGGGVVLHEDNIYDTTLFFIITWKRRK